jgi:hypothetical protein
MNMPFSLLMLAPIAIVLFIVTVVIPSRVRMERRARAILAQYPGAEMISVYLAFRSGWWSGKGKEMDAKVAELAAAGWTFLRATEASPLRTIRSWGGGVTLHFVRVPSDEFQTTQAA